VITEVANSILSAGTAGPTLLIRVREAAMKLQCRCGETVIDSEVTQKYCWMTTRNWVGLLDTIDSEIEKIKDSSMQEDAIMRIRYAASSGQVWECPFCNRLITIHDGKVISLLNESASEQCE
jgi:hypothetical protein